MNPIENRRQGREWAKKKSIGFKITGLLTEIAQLEMSNTFVLWDKFVLFSILRSWYFYEK